MRKCIKVGGLKLPVATRMTCILPGEGWLLISCKANLSNGNGTSITWNHTQATIRSRSQSQHKKKQCIISKASNYLEERMETAYDMSISCFNLIFISSTGELMKTAYNLYENNLTVISVYTICKKRWLWLNYDSNI